MDATMIGFVHPYMRTPIINPKDSVIIPAGAKFVFVADQLSACCQPLAQPYEVGLLCALNMHMPHDVAM